MSGSHLSKDFFELMYAATPPVRNSLLRNPLTPPSLGAQQEHRGVQVEAGGGQDPHERGLGAQAALHRVALAEEDEGGDRADDVRRDARPRRVVRPHPRGEHDAADDAAVEAGGLPRERGVPPRRPRAHDAAGEHAAARPQELQLHRGVRVAHRDPQARERGGAAGAAPRGRRAARAPAGGGAEEGGDVPPPLLPGAARVRRRPGRHAAPRAVRQGPGGDGRVALHPPRDDRVGRVGQGAQGPRPLVRLDPQADHRAPAALLLRLPPRPRAVDPDQTAQGALESRRLRPARERGDVRGAVRGAAPRRHRDQHRLRRHPRVRADDHHHLPVDPAARDGRQSYLALRLVGEPQPQVPRDQGAGVDRAGRQEYALDHRLLVVECMEDPDER